MSTENNKLKATDFAHEGNAVSSDDGDNLFVEINKLIKSGLVVELDFAGISIITTAFLNSAIGQLYSEYNSEQLNHSLKLINVSEEDKILFKKVVERAKEYFANKKGFEDSANSAMHDS
jgi:hypothetical protein